MDSAEEGASSGRRMSGGINHFRLRWSSEMEKLVVDLWEENIDDYFGERKRRVIYKEMAATITAEGFPVVWTDVRNKLENLTKKYRIERERATKESPSRWRHFEKIKSLLSVERPARPANQESVKKEVVEDTCSETLDDFEIPLENVDTDIGTQSELLIIAREQLQIQREEQLFNREHRRAQLKVLKYIARSQDRLHSLLVQLLTDSNDDE